MSKAQLVITAVVLEGRSKSQVARDYDVSRYWVQQLVHRYEAEGAAAFTPRSRRPRHSVYRRAGRPPSRMTCGPKMLPDVPCTSAETPRLTRSLRTAIVST
ncbi:MAG: helix-turn-helix domain-containing protein [Mycobacterium sp.]